jgi:hypothetical protein
MQTLLQLLHPLLRGLAKGVGQLCKRVDQPSNLHEGLKLGSHGQIVVVRSYFERSVRRVLFIDAVLFWKHTVNLSHDAGKNNCGRQQPPGDRSNEYWKVDHRRHLFSAN